MSKYVPATIPFDAFASLGLHQPRFLQALSGLTIAVLTIVLIILNVIYVTANWKTMRLMEADVRFRLKPIPHIGRHFQTLAEGNVREFILTLRAEHAPMRLVGLHLDLTMRSTRKTHTLTFNEDIVYETTPLRRDYKIDLPSNVTSWRATLFYRDLTGFLDYTTYFGDEGFVGEGKTVNRHSLYNKIRFRVLYFFRVRGRKEA